MTPKNWILNDKLLGQLMFLVLFFLSLFFYLERTIFVDPCYAVFNLFYYRDYVSEADRYAAVIPQTLALLAIQMNLPLRIILAVYSMSFILLYYLVFLVIAYGFKLSRLALAVPLVLLLGVKYSFYWISTETHQALVYTVLFYAFLTYSLTLRPGWFTWLFRLTVATGILLLCFYSHPVAMFPVLFVLGFFVIGNKLWLKPDGYILGGIIVALAVFKYLTSSPSGYESIYFRGFGEFFERLGFLFKSESLLFLKSKILNIYLFSMIIFLVTAAWYVVKKQYLKLAYYLVSLLLFSLILFNTFDIFYYPFIQEKNLMGLNVFLLIPFLKDVVFPSGKGRLIMQYFLVLVFIFAVAHVVSGSRFFRERLAYIQSLVNTARHFPEKKFIIRESMIDRERLNVNWALAPETLILSSLDGPDSSVSMYINDTYGKVQEDLRLDDSLLFICAPWAQILEIRKLNKHYFNLKHSPYRVLTEKDFVRGTGITVYTNRFDDKSFCAGKDSFRTDSSGNSYFVLNSEFSPGYYGSYAGLTKHPSVLLTAMVRISPLEKIPVKGLNLVISKEQNQVVLEYFNSGLEQPDTLKIGQWTTLMVTGLVSSHDPNDQLKVYLWNPAKKKVAMDDLEISYQVVRP
jgi:hypothetical protein